ncbi:PREDICTED: mediator of RNA polymerase II transcription subunit 18-like [Priapulus caudatus]|uniref:Mediator of RNA polymerase II transcription subunit 18 n=1 Tax=Priapulus caudatus TaxID=37621 RepID=A0ABM1EMV3_PRICU|nr:PREDICTED: mediator of RNA polymerase II transcription subunit 18-like [Priapulus caudatus]XP_014673525.1 PREDICTED: mediator of RNA polymerase II transcription subunit 18-like [Priapulus caudatus]
MAESLSSVLPILPAKEYYLQGSIHDAAKDILLHRLRGLCDCTESEPESFHDHEMVYVIRGVGIGGVQQMPITVRASQSLEHPEEPWHLRYVGNPEASGTGVDRSKSAMVRTCIDVGTSDDLIIFLQELGFRLDFEYVTKGYMFRKGRMKVTVSKVFRVVQPGKTDSIEPMSLSCLVELSLTAPAGQDAVADDMKTFAEQLKPLVQLEKIDTRRLQSI